MNPAHYPQLAKLLAGLSAAIVERASRAERNANSDRLVASARELAALAKRVAELAGISGVAGSSESASGPDVQKLAELTEVLEKLTLLVASDADSVLVAQLVAQVTTFLTLSNAMAMSIGGASSAMLPVEDVRHAFRAAPDEAPPPRAPMAAAPPAPVFLGASAPRIVRPTDEFTARFVAYVAAEEQAVRKLLAGLSPSSESHLGLKVCQWQPGTVLTVHLAARGLQISPEAQEFTWDGTKALVEFDVSVPEAATHGRVVLKFDVRMQGVTVAMLRVDLEIAAASSATSSEQSTATGAAAHTAFASYSSNDRARVLDRVDAVRIATGLDIFLDCLSLHPGEAWKQRLEQEIPARDLFMLFWSADAAKSAWVDWEWRRAVSLKGLAAMQIHPLENGLKPPPELQDLHFGSVAMYARDGKP